MSSVRERSAPLTEEERKSLTHGGFRLEPEQRRVYGAALEALGRRGPPAVVSGLYALWQHTGIYRRTKDLDLLLRPDDVVEAARVLREEGFRTVLAGRHWLGKAFQGDIWIDLVFGMANGLHLVDDRWIEHAHRGEFAGHGVLVASPEDLIYHRLFIWERHRSDMSDIAHLFLIHGPTMDWDHLLSRVGGHWRLLLAQIHFYDFVYPGRGDRIPREVRRTLLERANREAEDGEGDPRVCQGTLISLFSFAIDVDEWGFLDYRREAVEATCSLPVVEHIREADVWDEIEGTDPVPPPSPSPWGPPPGGPTGSP